MAWCRTTLWIWLLAAVCERCCSSRSSFSNSLSLTRDVRVRVQQLLLRFKEEHFGDRDFDDKRIVLNTLPSVTINYRTWLQMEDTERLDRASRDLQSFWTHLESQRQNLHVNSEGIEDRDMKRRRKRGKPCRSLSQSILGIQLDLRDLMRQVNSQLLIMRTLKKTDDLKRMSTSSPSAPSTSTVSPHGTRSALDLVLSSAPSTTHLKEGVASLATVRHNSPRSFSSQWVSALEGYVILRDLERYLSRLVRDYTLLRAKSRQAKNP